MLVFKYTVERQKGVILLSKKNVSFYQYLTLCQQRVFACQHHQQV